MDNNKSNQDLDSSNGMIYTDREANTSGGSIMYDGIDRGLDSIGRRKRPVINDTKLLTALPSGLKAAIKKLAKAQDSTVSELVRYLLRKHVSLNATDNHNI